MKEKILFLFDLIVSLILGFIINYFITSNILTIFFQGIQSLYILLSMIVLAIQILFIFIILRLCRTKKINNYIVKLLFVCYICIMIILLFGREIRDRAISMSISPLFNFSDFQVLFQNIFNVVLFLPIGYLFKSTSNKYIVLYAFINVIAIEVIQLLTNRGVFDICDIILNMLGILIGWHFTKNIICKLQFNE